MAFTLIELLIVIGVIAILAALTFPAMKAARLSVMRSRAKGEVVQMQTVIERYHDKLGFYPPDNPGNWALPPLYYELLGTTNTGTATSPAYVTLDGSARIGNPSAVFGPNVTGFSNCAGRSRHGDEAPTTMPFLSDLKPTQFMDITNSSGGSVYVLGTSLDGPLMYHDTKGGRINPWRYNSSSPTNNTKSFDLWIDLTAGSKTIRICNWSDKPITLSP